jgi:hypothetical protein
MLARILNMCTVTTFGVTVLITHHFVRLLSRAHRQVEDLTLVHNGDACYQPSTYHMAYEPYDKYTRVNAMA